MNLLNLFIHIVFLLACAPSNEGRNNDAINYFLTKSGITKTQFHARDARNGKLLVTNLDDGRDLYRIFRQLLLNDRYKNFQYLYINNRQLGKVQRPRSWEEFPCPLNGTKSSTPPSSVDEVRPGDIDVIAAIGDSLSAGNGIFSETFLDIMKEYRSLAFSGGGEADWRTVLTLPNILKVFNPNLYGFATADVVSVERRSFLNVAEPMVMSRDLVFQVQILIERMKKDPRIDMANHWKLLTIFVGSNDICSDICHHDNLWEFLKKHEVDLRRAFTLLRDNVPRLMVNLIPVPNLVKLRHMPHTNFQCDAIHHFGCHCIFGSGHDAKYFQTMSEFVTRWQHVDEYVASLAEFQTQDFAILYQSFTTNITTPLLPNGDIDMRFLASDCFHFSQLGHAAVANNLWNNMFQASGMKTTLLGEPFMVFECPTEDKPFIATLRNT